MDIDQKALDIVEKWEREAAGKPYSQQKAMLQLAVIKILKDRDILRSRLEALVAQWSKDRIALRDAGFHAEAGNLSKRLEELRKIIGGGCGQ